jgi:hypothetical protein
MTDFTTYTRKELKRRLYWAQYGLDLYTRKPKICKTKAEHTAMIAKFNLEIETINSLLSATSTN